MKVIPDGKKIRASLFLFGLTLACCALQAQQHHSALSVDSAKSGLNLMNKDDQKQHYQPAIDSLNQIVRFLEKMMGAIESKQADKKDQIDKISGYLRESGRGMEESLARNFIKLHPENETMKTDLARRFHYLMQSFALYRSDLRKSDFRETESSKEEYEYLRKGLPQLLERLKHMITYNRYTNWKKQNKIDELNGYLQDAFGHDTPIHFTIDGIDTKTVKSVNWHDFRNMTIDRNKGEAIITTTSGRDVTFRFSAEQYTHIASVHVHLLAFYKEFQTP